jgi:hypothetical protein
MKHRGHARQHGDLLPRDEIGHRVGGKALD